MEEEVMPEYQGGVSLSVQLPQVNVKIKDEIIDRNDSAKSELYKDIRMMNSILRIPRMCTEFQKAFKKKLDVDAQRKAM